MNFLKVFERKSHRSYSTHNEGNYVVAERFIKTLKNKIYKHSTALCKNVYFDV